MPILHTVALTRRFGPLTAVDALTLDVSDGEVFGLLGPNGAGKSTAIKMLTMLLPPSAGTAAVAGFDIVRQAAEVRRVIGYVPQALSADGSLTGYENLLAFSVSIRTETVPMTSNATRSATGVGPNFAHSARLRGRSTTTTAFKPRSSWRI
jgi:ABC-type multidrug transport system ATPase subunit